MPKRRVSDIMGVVIIGVERGLIIYGLGPSVGISEKALISISCIATIPVCMVRCSMADRSGDPAGWRV